MDIIQVENKHLSEIRKKILEKQENKCILCERTVTKDMVMCVDHCHKTGRIRAVLCLNCNAMAGKIEQRIKKTVVI